MFASQSTAEEQPVELLMHEHGREAAASLAWASLSLVRASYMVAQAEPI